MSGLKKRTCNFYNFRDRMKSYLKHVHLLRCCGQNEFITQEMCCTSMFFWYGMCSESKHIYFLILFLFGVYHEQMLTFLCPFLVVCRKQFRISFQNPTLKYQDFCRSIQLLMRILSTWIHRRRTNPVFCFFPISRMLFTASLLTCGCK